jgi:hypothetical protein
MPNDPGLFGQPTQPWDVVPTVLEQENSVYRDQLLTRLANSDLGQVESKVARILQKYPETRDDDVELALRFWREYEAATIAAWQRLDLQVLHDLQNIGTIVRCRQRIQNDYGLFIGTRRTRYNRSELQMEFY